VAVICDRGFGPQNQETADGDRTYTTSSALSQAETRSGAGARCQAGQRSGEIGVLAFAVVLIIGVIYAGPSLASDLSGVHNASILPYLLLGLALLVALGFAGGWVSRPPSCCFR